MPRHLFSKLNLLALATSMAIFSVLPLQAQSTAPEVARADAPEFDIKQALETWTMVETAMKGQLTTPRTPQSLLYEALFCCISYPHDPVVLLQNAIEQGANVHTQIMLRWSSKTCWVIGWPLQIAVQGAKARSAAILLDAKVSVDERRTCAPNTPQEFTIFEQSTPLESAICDHAAGTVSTAKKVILRMLIHAGANTAREAVRINPQLAYLYDRHLLPALAEVTQEKAVTKQKDIATRDILVEHDNTFRDLAPIICQYAKQTFLEYAQDALQAAKESTPYSAKQ